MLMKSRPTVRYLTVILTGILAVTFTLPVNDAMADRRRPRPGRVIISPPHIPPGRVVPNLPSRHRRVIVKDRELFFHGGVFYGKWPGGFVVLGPPVGTVVVNIGIGFETVLFGGILYYYTGGLFYRRVPRGYMVIEPPPEVIFVERPPVVVEPAREATGMVTVTALRLNVRTGPSLDQPVIYQVNQNDLLVIQGSAPGWLYVETPSGGFGWVMTGFTAPVLPPASG